MIRHFRYVRFADVPRRLAQGWMVDGVCPGHHGEWAVLCIYPEIWKPVCQYEGIYEVSSHGNVRSLDRVLHKSWAVRGYPRHVKGRLLKPRCVKRYLQIKLCGESGNHRQHYVAHLVAFAFIGPRPEGHQICHEDGDTLNNVAFNLRFDTNKGNDADKDRHGTRRRGGECGTAKLTQSQVDFIRSNKGKISQSALARRLGVSQPNISLIQAGKSWVGSNRSDDNLSMRELPA